MMKRWQPRPILTVARVGLVLWLAELSCAFGNKDRVKLCDIDVLTLDGDRYTTGRRSSPIPQMKCVGGTAGCNSFKPQVVQCYNRGTDGYDVQWECKTDMDNAYRFGHVEIICEGYDSSDDPYILRGSCGLEYTIDYSKEGYAKKHAYDNHDNFNYQYEKKKYTRNWFQGSSHFLEKATSTFGDIIFLVLVAVIIYVIYRSCIASPFVQPGNPPYSEYTSHTQMPQPPPSYSDYPSRASAPPPPTAPPPPGFRTEYMHNTGMFSTSSQNNSNSGGWWAGFTSGGLLGYLFGNSSIRQHQVWGNGWGRGWGNSGWGSNWGSSSNRGSPRGHSSWGQTSSSTGTRTASGYGGTRRR